MNPQAQRILGSVLGAAVGAGSPARAKTVLLALVIVVVGLGFWIRHAAKGPPTPVAAGMTAPADQKAGGGGWDFSRPVPGYVRFCASYIGGFFIGWAFRRFIRLAVGLTVLVVMVAGLGKFVGWNTAPAETAIKERATWVEHEATVARDYLRGLLPSATAGGVGAFLGFRRKGGRAEIGAPPPVGGSG